MQGALKYKNIMLNLAQSLERQFGDICIQIRSDQISGSGCVKIEAT